MVLLLANMISSKFKAVIVVDELKWTKLQLCVKLTVMNINLPLHTLLIDLAHSAWLYLRESRASTIASLGLGGKPFTVCFIKCLACFSFSSVLQDELL